MKKIILTLLNILVYIMIFICVIGTIYIIAVTLYNDNKILNNRTPREILIDTCERECTSWSKKDYVCIEKCIEVGGEFK